MTSALADNVVRTTAAHPSAARINGSVDLPISFAKPISAIRRCGASTELLLAPQGNVAVAVMANVDGWTGAHAVATKIVEIVSR